MWLAQRAADRAVPGDAGAREEIVAQSQREESNFEWTVIAPKKAPAPCVTGKPGPSGSNDALLCPGAFTGRRTVGLHEGAPCHERGAINPSFSMWMPTMTPCVVSGSVQRGFSAILPRAPQVVAPAVRPDAGETL